MSVAKKISEKLTQVKHPAIAGDINQSFYTAN
jgi:hypothetical protein